MRIAIVAEYVRPWPGGVSEHVHHEAAELRRRGHAVTVLSGPGAPEPGVCRLGRELRFTSNGALSRVTLGAELLRLRRLLDALGVEVVHAHSPLESPLTLAAVGASPGAAVGTFHASFRPGPLWDVLYRALRPVSGAAFRRLDGRIAVSEEARRSIAHYFPARYEIVPNGVDVARFRPDVPPVAPRDPARPTVLFVGRADPRKGLPVLRRAFGEVRRRVPGARLVVVGAGAWSDDGVEAVGYAAPAKLPRYYAACDVFCSPATGGESQGIVLLEAMASGRAVVASDIAGYRDVVARGWTGLLVPPGDAAALAEALVELLSDPSRREELGQAGRAAALGYAWPAVAARLEALFAGALAGRL